MFEVRRKHIAFSQKYMLIRERSRKKKPYSLSLFPGDEVEKMVFLFIQCNILVCGIAIWKSKSAVLQLQTMFNSLKIFTFSSLVTMKACLYF